MTVTATLAGYGQRVAGLMIDTIVLVLVLFPGAVFIAVGGVAMTFIGIVICLIGFATVIALSARDLALRGCWLGNRITGTVVVDANSGSLIDPGRAARRTLVRHLISPILLLGFAVAFVDPQRRTLHDRVAGTLVIRSTPAR